MTQFVRNRLQNETSDRGAYAILYAALIVVLFGMGALVVDNANVRQDRRLNRSAADSAVMGAAEFLSPQGVFGLDPHRACLRAWDYLELSLKISRADASPTGVCSNFSGINVATKCAGTNPTEIDDDRVVGHRTIRVAWPIPGPGMGSGFLTPDIAPGNVSQGFDPNRDGMATGPGAGCDRIGVAVFHDVDLALGGGIGVSGTSTQVHSVARFDPKGGPLKEVAALNVLEPGDCDTLRVTGGGKVVVGPTLENGSPIGPGIIAVESTGRATCSGTTAKVITMSGSGSTLCAALTPLNALATNCDGLGVIRSHALDPGGERAYNTADTSAGTLRPTPTPEGGAYGWSPVTELYGCEDLSPCAPAGTNYIEALTTALGTGGMPTGFTDESAYFCPKTPTAMPAFFAPGNHWINCDLKISDGRTVIFQGGKIVINGGIDISAGCLVVNTMTCTPTYENAGTSTASVVPIPTSEALVYLRGDTLAATETCPSSAPHNTLILPQTFVYQAAAAKNLNVKTTCGVFWTAPGAGRVTDGRTTLESACFVATPAPGAVSPDCLNSHFSTLAYWSEYPAPTNKAANFGGQGSLSLVGVFFTPRAALNLAGGADYSAASAQFWARVLDLNGTGTLLLSPDARTAIKSPSGHVALIR